VECGCRLTVGIESNLWIAGEVMDDSAVENATRRGIYVFIVRFSYLKRVRRLCLVNDLSHSFEVVEERRTKNCATSASFSVSNSHFYLIRCWRLVRQSWFNVWTFYQSLSD